MSRFVVRSDVENSGFESRREHTHVGPLRVRKPGVALTVWPRRIAGRYVRCATTTSRGLRPDVRRLADPRVEVRRVEHEEPARSKVSAEGPETTPHVGRGGEVIERCPEAQERVEDSPDPEASHVRNSDFCPQARLAEVAAGHADHLRGEVPPHDGITPRPKGGVACGSGAGEGRGAAE